MVYVVPMSFSVVWGVARYWGWSVTDWTCACTVCCSPTLLCVEVPNMHGEVAREAADLHTLIREETMCSRQHELKINIRVTFDIGFVT